MTENNKNELGELKDLMLSNNLTRYGRNRLALFIETLEKRIIDENILKDLENITYEKYSEDTPIDYILINLIHEIEKRDDKIKELETSKSEKFYPSEEYGY